MVEVFFSQLESSLQVIGVQALGEMEANKQVNKWRQLDCGFHKNAMDHKKRKEEDFKILDYLIICGVKIWHSKII